MTTEKFSGEDFLIVQNKSWPQPFQKLRRQAFEAYLELDFPTTRNEDWRFTNVAPFLRSHLKLSSAPAQLPSEIARGFTKPDGESWQIVFLDGRYIKELSSIPSNFFVGNLSEAGKQDSAWEYLGQIVPFDRNTFTAWNTAFFSDAALVIIPDGFVEKKPIQISFVNSAQEDAVIFPRVLVVVGKESQISFLESYTSLNGGRSVTNAVTEIVLKESAVVQHVKMQQDSDHSLHIASSHVLQDRNGSYASLYLTLGGELSREDLKVILNGVGGDCSLNGLYLLAENQHADHHTTIDHAKPHGTSRELYKGILDGKARAVFNGKIIVRKDAQKTDAEQTNKNLLLSPHSRVNTTPQFEILADDVKCRHGATIGHLEEDALFYLRSRGLAEKVARTILMKGFLQDVTGKLPEGKVRDLLDELVTSRLLQFTGVNV
jgi:Fe-S cluster assembly protein SufD